jgi:1,2-phenylacetyl-CoA epoxidase catalytic subunit
MKATTDAPDEVKRLFTEYADVLEVYASDQRAMAARGIRRTDANIRAAFYAEIANEMRSIEFVRE